MTNSTNYDAAVDELVRKCSEHMSRMAELAEQAVGALEAGVTLGEHKGIDEAHYETLFEVVESLCSEGRFSEGLAVALQLVAHEPRDWRFPFIAASCLQRLGQAPQAIPFYGLSLLAKATPDAALRLGECYGAVGNTEAALQCFEATPGLCIGSPDEDDLRVWALDAAQALRAT